MPRVSVIIPTFNRAVYLVEAIQSVLSQTYRDFEIVVVDVGSTDSTSEIVAGFKDAVRYFYRPRNNPASARNFGLSMTDSEYVALLDSDDVWKQDRLQRMVPFLDCMPATGMIHGPVEVIDSKGQPDEKATRRISHFYRIEKKEGTTYSRVLTACALFSSAVLLRRQCFETVGGYDESLPMLEDYDFYLRFLLSYPMHLMEGPPVVSYRIHQGNLTFGSDRTASAEIYIRILEKQLGLIQTGFRGIAYGKARRMVLTRLADFHWMRKEKEQVRGRILEAFRHDPLAIFYPRLIKRLILAL